MYTINDSFLEEMQHSINGATLLYNTTGSSSPIKGFRLLLLPNEKLRT